MASESLSHAVELNEIISQYPEYKAFYQDELTPAPEDGIYRDFYPVQLWGGGELHLPLRRLQLDPADAEKDIGIALLMTSEVDHETLRVLSERMAQRLLYFEQETGLHFDKLAGIAKLGYSLAQRVSTNMPGHDNWVPIDSSPKLWYRDELSASAHSVTSGDIGKKMYLDPYLLSRVRGNSLALIDDAVNTGGSAAASIQVLRQAGAKDLVCAPLFTEGHDWEQAFAQIDFPNEKVVSLGHLPVFAPHESGGWTPIPQTL